MLKIAHRGASGYAPENSLKAFQKAIELGADMIELDVHLLSNQKPVTRNQTTKQSSPLLIVTHEKRGWFSQSHALRGTVPSENRPLFLQDVIHFVHGKVQLNIEIKEGGQVYEGIEDQLIELLENENFEDQSLVSCFDARTIEKVKRLRPTLRCAYIFDRRAERNLHLASDLGMDAIHPRWPICTPELVETAHQKKLKVHVWTVNTPGQAAYFKKIGVDGIMSDYHDILG